MRRPMHYGQNPRPLHETGTRSSSPHRHYMVCTKPRSKSARELLFDELRQRVPGLFEAREEARQVTPHEHAAAATGRIRRR
jgi:hypothetical protein